MDFRLGFPLGKGGVTLTKGDEKGAALRTMRTDLGTSPHDIPSQRRTDETFRKLKKSCVDLRISQRAGSYTHSSIPAGQKSYLHCISGKLKTEDVGRRTNGLIR